MSILYRTYFVTFFLLLISFAFVAFLRANTLKTKNYWQSKSEFPFDKPISGLTYQEEDSYVIGRSFFTVPWVEAPSATTARDGLGPLFNSNTCSGCHFKRKGMDVIDKNGKVNRHLVFKLGRPNNFGTDAEHLLLADDAYGGQISTHGTRTNIFEAKTNLKIKYKVVQFPDSEKVRLRYFKPYLSELNYGKLNQDSRISLRMTITLVGLGLIKKIPAKLILRNADAEDKNHDGISGRPNWVYNSQSKKHELGKYGYKLSQSGLTMQVADAAFHDMSLTNPWFTQDNCTATQTDCLNAPKGLATDTGVDLELPMQRLKGISFYLQSLKAPPPYDKKHKGFQVFQEAGCSGCHRSDYQVSKILRVSPFSDFLLHDMGGDLADSRYEGEASPWEWRTAPLWGLAAKTKSGIPLLHDGRAQDIQQAILWHGGEAENAKQKFMYLHKQTRKLLINFLERL